MDQPDYPVMPWWRTDELARAARLEAELNQPDNGDTSAALRQVELEQQQRQEK
jgi:hypothetical protein